MAMFSRIFEISGAGMAVQSRRLQAVASNLANANNISGDPDKVYKARTLKFAAVYDEFKGDTGNSAVGVRVSQIIQSNAPAVRLYEPSNPLADKDGYVYKSNVNAVDEIVNMMEASKAYRNNVEVLNTIKQLMTATIRMGE